MPGLQVAAGLLLLAAVSCGRPSEVVESQRVLAAIDALRDAPGLDTRRRRALLEALERQPAGARPAVEAREACSAAYRALLDADDLGREAGRGLLRGERTESPRQILEAEAGVAQARILMPGCESALAGLRHRGPPRPLP